MSETTSLKTLAYKVLQRNKPGNKSETEALFGVSPFKAHETKQLHDERYYTMYFEEHAAIFQRDEKFTKAEAEHNVRLEALVDFLGSEYPEILNVFESIITSISLIK